jgi:two-component system nitrate/nitrite response regulator NarL
LGREVEILKRLMEGESNKVIARKLDIAEATIKVHVKTILRKVRAQNRTQAALWATAHLSPPSHPDEGGR